MGQKNYEECYRAYTITKEAWYYPYLSFLEEKFTDEVYFGLYNEEGGTTGEMAVRWILSKGESAPRLEAFDDSWGVLAEFKDVIDKMAEIDSQNVSVQDFCKMLEYCGFKDVTHRKRKEEE